MKRAPQFIIIVLILAVGIIGVTYVLLRNPSRGERPVLINPQPHFYDNPQQPIKAIRIRAVYFVPRDREIWSAGNWREIFESKLDALVQFHDFQFRGRSGIVYEVYDQPVIGQFDHILYDSDTTQFGNPNALRSAAVELESRLLNSEGDLYDSQYATSVPGEYDLLYIMYEGVGASGSDNVAFISRVFLTEKEYESHGASFFAHEFYHTLGVPEGYEIPSSISLTNDVMGYGRYRPLERTHLSAETLSHMGF